MVNRIVEEFMISMAKDARICTGVLLGIIVQDGNLSFRACGNIAWRRIGWLLSFKCRRLGKRLLDRWLLLRWVVVVCRRRFAYPGATPSFKGNC